MVVSNPLGPGKFYGLSLPRPHIYNDTNSLSGRVDPPVNFTEPLMNWANQAHWSMGGLSFKRLRLMGKIEGNVKKLRVQREKQQKFQTPVKKFGKNGKSFGKNIVKNVLGAPIGKKTRRVLIDESENESEFENEGVEVKDLKVEGLVGKRVENEGVKVKDLKVEGLEGKRKKRLVRKRVLVDESESESEFEDEGVKVKDLKVKGLGRKRVESESESEDEGVKVKDLKVVGRERKRLARRLNEDFDKVADKSPVKNETGIRVSPRLAKKTI